MNGGTVPVTFANGAGLKLFGIMHIPHEHQRRDACVIFLCPGSKNRVAPHRLYVKMAEKFCSMGFMALRFDPHGIGDSEGEVEQENAAEFYSSVQVGRYVADTRSAMDWVETHYGVSTFILTGLCGGAITGLLTAAGDARVKNLIGLGIPVILDSRDCDHSKYMTRDELIVHRGLYLGKLLSPRAWLRFLSFKSDYRVIYKSIFTKQFQGRKISSSAPKETGKELDTNLNPYFAEALHKTLRSRKVLLVFSESDRLYSEFNEKYLDHYGAEFDNLKGNIEVRVISNANHIFSFKEWQDSMLEASCGWLLDNCPEVSRPGKVLSRR